MNEELILQFIEELPNNVRTISYDVNADLWTISWQNNLKGDQVSTDNLAEFLTNV